jgi:hypothetical protein
MAPSAGGLLRFSVHRQQDHKSTAERQQINHSGELAGTNGGPASLHRVRIRVPLTQETLVRYLTSHSTESIAWVRAKGGVAARPVCYCATAICGPRAALLDEGHRPTEDTR